MWMMLHECRVDDNLIRCMSSLYCVRFGSRVRQYFQLRRELRKGCVMFPWFFDIFFDRVVREVNEKATCREVKLGGKLNNYYTNMTVLEAETRDHLQHIVNEFERTRDRMGRKINVGKSKVPIVNGDQRGDCKVRVSGKEIQ